MILSNEQIEFIENNLKLYGVASKELRDDLLDHICSHIEAQESDDFNTLYQEALQKFGGYSSFQHLQLETSWQKINKQLMVLNQLKFIVGCSACILLAISLIFKMMHWPFANVMLISAMAIMALVALPIHFYQKYRASIHKLS